LLLEEAASGVSGTLGPTGNVKINQPGTIRPSTTSILTGHGAQGN